MAEVEKHFWGLRSGVGDYKDSYFSPDAEVLGSANVIESRLQDSCIAMDFCNIRESMLEQKSVVCGYAFVEKSLIINSTISHKATVYNSFVKDSVIGEFARVFNSYIINGRVYGRAYFQNAKSFSATVSGDSFVETELPYGAILEGGFWSKPPLVFTCKSGFTVCEAEAGNIIISCKKTSIDQWYKVGRRYGRLIGLKDEDIDEIEGYVNIIKEKKK